MKPRCSNQHRQTLTLAEVLVIVVVLVVLAAVFLPTLARTKDGHRPVCLQNQKQIVLSFYVWAGDHNDKYPMQVSVTNWGAMELAVTGNVTEIFRVMSNELNTPKILVCPEDKNRVVATDFAAGLSGANISYFVSLDVDKKYPQMVFSGDDNLAVKGKPVQPGILILKAVSNASVEWTMKRHDGDGNVAFADGSVNRINNATLQQAIQPTGLATNRLAIP